MSVKLTNLRIYNFNAKQLLSLEDKLALVNGILKQYFALQAKYLNNPYPAMSDAKLDVAKEEARIARIINIELHDLTERSLMELGYGIETSELIKTILDAIHDRYINKLVYFGSFSLCNNQIRFCRPTGA